MRALSTVTSLMRACILGMASILLAVLLGLTHIVWLQSISLSTVRELGVVEGDPDETFGIIGDVGVDPEGRLYILDSRLNRLSVFNAGGNLIQSTGRSGRGPGEFFLPAALSVRDSRTVYVLDSGNLAVSEFALGDSSLRYVGSFRLDFEGRDICAFDDRLYVLGLKGDHIIHEYGVDGRAVRSFGEALGAEHPILRMSFAMGYLECIEDIGLLVTIPLLLPQVRAFSPEGKLVWSVSLPGYREVVIQENIDGSVTYKQPAAGKHHMAASITYLQKERILIQIGEVAPGARSPDELVTIQSYLLSGEGEVHAIPDALPRIVAARLAFLYAVENNPFPKVTTYTGRLWEK